MSQIQLISLKMSQWLEWKYRDSGYICCVNGYVVGETDACVSSWAFG